MISSVFTISVRNCLPALFPGPSKFRISNVLIRYFTDTSKGSPTVKKTCKYPEECEIIVNSQITTELEACYAYLEIATYFGRNDVALPGCFAFFFQMHLEELSHAHNLIRYQNMRGARVCFSDLKTLGNSDWTISKSFEKGLELETDVKDKLEKVAEAAEKNKEFSLADFIITDFIQIQDKSIQEYARWLHRYKNMSCAHCSCIDYLFDKELHHEYSKACNHEELKLTSCEKRYK